MIEIYSCATCRYYVPDDDTLTIGCCENINSAQCGDVRADDCCDYYYEEIEYEHV